MECRRAAYSRDTRLLHSHFSQRCVTPSAYPWCIGTWTQRGALRQAQGCPHHCESPAWAAVWYRFAVLEVGRGAIRYELAPFAADGHY